MSNSKELSQLSGIVTVSSELVTIDGKLSVTDGTDANHVLTKSQVESLIQTKDQLSELSGTTDDVDEGSANLYYTDARVQSKLGNVSGHVIPDTDITYDLGSATYRFRDLYLSGNSIYMDGITLTNDDGVFSVIDDNSDPVAVSLSTNTTSDLAEGTNLYYTEVRAQAAITVDTTLSKTGGQIIMPASGVTAGSYGSASTVPVITVDAQGRITSATTTNVAGVSGFSYTSATNTFTITTSAGTSFDAVGDLVSFDTDDLTEGSTNLYYTTARANSDFDTRLATKSTTDVAEGTNLYWTTARGESMFDTRLATKTTSDLGEGTNLYYTDTRARAAISVSGGLLTYDSGVVDLTSEAIQDVVGAMVSSNSESGISVTYNDAGNVLDFSVDTTTIATRSYVDSSIQAVIDAAPAALDTLNELAAAINDDANYAATVTTALSNKADKSTTVTAGTGLSGGGTLDSSFTISHADTSSQVSVDNSGNTFIQDITLDGFGHITAIASGTVTVGDGAMTVTAGSGLTGGGQLGTANQSGASSVTISHADTSSVANLSSDNASGTVIQDVALTFDTYGHVTGASVATVDLDGRYYTETEADGRFVNVTGDTITGNTQLYANDGGNSPRLIFGPEAGQPFSYKAIYTDAYWLTLQGHANEGMRFKLVNGSSIGTYSTLTSSYLDHTASLRAPIFYDSDDTSYYVDPTSSTSAIFAGSVGVGIPNPINSAWGNSTNTRQMTIYGSNYGVLNLKGDYNTDAHYSMGVGDNRFYAAYDNIGGKHRLTFLGDFTGFNGITEPLYNIHLAGTGFASNDWRAPIFYDSNDTGYYADPASTSQFNFGRFKSPYYGGGSGVYHDDRMTLSVGNSGLGSIVYQSQYNGSVYPDYGMVFIHGASGGNRNVWSISPDGPARSDNLHFIYELNSTNIHTATTRFRLDGSGNSYSTASSRAPIFYDSDSTAYYLDPNSGTTSLKVGGALTQGSLLSRPYAVWGASASSTGAIVIKLPGNTANYGMIHAVIDIYEYNSNNVSTVTIGGHNWNGGWYSYGANVTGYTDKHVRVCTVGGQYAIVIGNDSSTWSYGQVVLRKIQNGSYYAGAMDLGGSYSIYQTTSVGASWDSGDLNSFRSTTITGVSSVHAPIFYDSNDTSYYVDPNGGANLKGGDLGFKFMKTSTGNSVGAQFMNQYGNNSWGIVAEFKIGSGSGSDRPSILFSNGYDTNTWSVGFGYADSSYFRINRDHGYVNGGWGTTLMTMDRSGNVTFAGNVTAYSDVRIKKNIKLIENPIQKVQALNGVTFNYIEDDREGLGVIAQNVEEVLPMLVTETPNSNGEMYKNVAYGNMVGLLIEAIKEQQTQIEDQKSEIAELKSIINTLVDKVNKLVD